MLFQPTRMPNWCPHSLRMPMTTLKSRASSSEARHTIQTCKNIASSAPYCRLLPLLRYCLPISASMQLDLLMNLPRAEVIAAEQVPFPRLGHPLLGLGHLLGRQECLLARSHDRQSNVYMFETAVTFGSTWLYCSCVSVMRYGCSPELFALYVSRMPV